MTEAQQAAEFIKNCKDPFFFIEKMWGKTPQPCYPQFQEVLKNTEPEQWKAEWFGEEVDGTWIWKDFRRKQHITWQQSAILEGVRRAVEQYGTATNKIAVKSGNGIGKGCCSSWLICWFLFCFPDSVVPCTAPTSSQMNDALWKEVALWIYKMPDVYKDQFEWTSSHVRNVESPETWYARARTSRKEQPEAFSGVHADSVMALADEASGVPDVIFEYGKGIMTAPFWLFFMFSNPTRLTGHFRNAFKEGSGWRCYTFKSTESPVVPPGFVQEKLKDSGYDSDDYNIFVNGQFPKADAADEQGYVPLFTEAEITNAQVNDGDFKYTMQGIDPSGEGRDKSSFVGRNMSVAKILAEEDISTPKSIAAKGNTFISLFGIKPQNTIVDNFGSGANVAVEMARAGFDVFPLNVGDKANDKRYMNRRAELTWLAREWIKAGGQLVRDKRWDELLNLRYRYSESGKLQIMSKEKMKKEGIPSPNHADAFMLSFAADDNTTSYEVTETENPFDVF